LDDDIVLLSGSWGASSSIRVVFNMDRKSQVQRAGAGRHLGKCETQE
jgi:hypothetical protein